MRPNFLCVGAQKSGTTTIHDILSQHPHVFLPDIKETKFFKEDHKYKQGMQYYMSTYFSDVDQQTVIGEVDPEYLYYEKVPQRIADTLGIDLKIIIILRNPADRAFSHYKMSLSRGYETLSFEDAIIAERSRLIKGDFERNHFSYIDRGLYYKQIKRYERIFGKENIMLILFEDFIDDPQRIVLDVFGFIGADTTSVPINDVILGIKSNSASFPKSVLIRDFFNDKSRMKYIRNAFKWIVPGKDTRTRIRAYIDFKNSRPMDMKLDPNTRNRVLHMFSEDMKRLKLDYGIDVSKWA